MAESEPSRVGDYVGLTKPGITALIVMVAVAGFFTASPYPPPWIRLVWLIIAGGLASGGAAALNHWYDRDLDAVMARTRHRPVPLAQIPPNHALALGVVLTVAGLLLSQLTLNTLTTLAIASGSVMYVLVYTVALKRRTRWNIVIGGYAGSAPALAGCAAVAGSISPAAWLLALLVFLWTPPHFWSLAIALKDDYGKVDLPMLPDAQDLQRSGRIVVVSAALLVVAGAAFILVAAHFLLFLVVAVVMGVLFVAMTSGLWKETSRPTAMRGFIFSGIYLLVIIVAMVANWVLTVPPLP